MMMMMMMMMMIIVLKIMMVMTITVMMMIMIIVIHDLKLLCIVGFVCWLVGCIASQQNACVSQGQICSDSFTCCHCEIEVADQTVYLVRSQYTDTGPTRPCADPITPDTWQGSHWSANFLCHWYDSTRENPYGASGNQTSDLPHSRRTP